MNDTISHWTFITRHGLVLASIAKNPEKTAREIGDDVGVTERTAHKIINDLEQEGYITKKKVGTRNTYNIHPGVPLKSGEAAVGELLMMLGWKHDKKYRPKQRTSA
jgi:DNA-binding Lrp family transcriptional regulator